MPSRSEIFRAKAAESPKNLLFQFSLGQALANEDNGADAIIPLQRCVEGRSDWMAPRILLGRCLLDQAQATAAANVLNEALNLAVTQGHEDPENEIRALLADVAS